jgi:predicted dehydrogenase
LRLGLVPLDAKQAEAGEWQAVDADLGYSILAHLHLPDGATASVLFQGSEMATGRYPNSLAFYGSKGALHLAGYFFPERIEHFDRTEQSWQAIQIPDEVNDLLAWTEDPVQSAWYQLVREFVADIRGEGYAGYPTFYDGWLANTVIDIVRSGQGWAAVPEWSNGLS